MSDHCPECSGQLTVQDIRWYTCTACYRRFDYDNQFQIIGEVRDTLGLMVGLAAIFLVAAVGVPWLAHWILL